MSKIAIILFQNILANIKRHSAIEQNRLDAQAAAIVEMFGGDCCLAPVQSMSSVSKAADIGCRTGVATVQIAGKFPFATVYGLDISPVPKAVRKSASANAAWVVGNVKDVDYNKPAGDVMSREIFTPGGLDYVLVVCFSWASITGRDIFQSSPARWSLVASLSTRI